MPPETRNDPAGNGVGSQNFKAGSLSSPMIARAADTPRQPFHVRLMWRRRVSRALDRLLDDNPYPDVDRVYAVVSSREPDQPGADRHQVSEPS